MSFQDSTQTSPFGDTLVRRAPAKMKPPPAPEAAAPPPPTSPYGDTLVRAAKPPGDWSTTRDVAKSVGSGFLSGIADMPRAPGAIADLATAGIRAGLRQVIPEETQKRWAETGTGIALTPEAEQRYYQLHPELQRSKTIGDVGEATSTGARAAMGGAADYVPQTTAGEYGKTIGEFLPYALSPELAPEVISGKLAARTAARIAAGNVLKSAVLPGAASEAAGQLTKGTPAEPYARAAGGLVGAGAGSLGRALISPKPSTALTEAAQRVGATVPRFATAEGMGATRLGELVGKYPVIGDPIPQSITETGKQLGAAAERAAGPAATTPYAAGTSLKGGLRDWIDTTSSSRVSDAYGQVGKLLPNARQDLSTTRDAVGDIVGRRQAAGLADGEGEAVKFVKNATQNMPGGMTYEGIQNLRTRVRQKINDLITPTPEKAELKQIYGALSGDLDSVVAQGGPQAKAAYSKASAMAKADAGRREALQKIVGAEGDQTGEGVFNRVQGMASSKGAGDAKTLAQARRSVSPEEWNKLSSSVVARMGRDPEGNFSPERFSTAYGNLSPAGKKLLFAGQGNLQQSLDDIAAISARLKQQKPLGNISGTAQQIIGHSMLGGIAPAVTGALFGAPSGLVGLAAEMGGAHVAARMLSRPATASSLAKWGSAYMRFATSPAPAAAAALAQASRNLSNTTNSELGSNLAPDQFMPKQKQPQ